MVAVERGVAGPREGEVRYVRTTSLADHPDGRESLGKLPLKACEGVDARSTNPTHEEASLARFGETQEFIEAQLRSSRPWREGSEHIAEGRNQAHVDGPDERGGHMPSGRVGPSKGRVREGAVAESGCVDKDGLKRLDRGLDGEEDAHLGEK